MNNMVSNATQRNATQRNATQRNNALKEIFNSNFNCKIILSLIIFIQVILLVTTYFNSERYIIAPDSQSYMEPAVNFLKTGSLVDDSGAYIWNRTPGYPLMLALVYSITNYSDQCVLILQMIMCVMISLMIFYIVKQVTAKNYLAVFAVLFYVCDLSTYSHTVVIMTEIPFAFFMTLALFLIIKYKFSHKNFYAVLSILAVNYALLIRPVLLYFNLIIALILLILIFMRKINYKLPVLYIMVYLAMFGGWCARNAYYHDVNAQTIYTTIRSKDSFLFYAPLLYHLDNNVKSIKDLPSALKITPTEEAEKYFAEILYAKYPDFDNLNFAGQVNAWSDIGQGYIKQHVPAYIIRNILGLFRELTEQYIYGIELLHVNKFIKYILFAASSLMLVILYLIYAFGFIKNFKKLNILDWVILFTALYLMAATAVIGYCRYRVAFYYLCVIGAFLSLRFNNNN